MFFSSCSRHLMMRSPQTDSPASPMAMVRLAVVLLFCGTTTATAATTTGAGGWGMDHVAPQCLLNNPRMCSIHVEQCGWEVDYLRLHQNGNIPDPQEYMVFIGNPTVPIGNLYYSLYTAYSVAYVWKLPLYFEAAPMFRKFVFPIFLTSLRRPGTLERMGARTTTPASSRRSWKSASSTRPSAVR